MRVELDRTAIAALATDPRVLGSVGEDNTIGGVAQGVAEEIADRARQVLAEETGGPESVRAEPARDGAGFDVSWTKDHPGMGFAELGTEHERARPFARPVADEINRRKS